MTSYDLRVTIYDLRFAIYDLRSTIYDLRVTIYDLRFTIYDLRSTIYDLRFTICDLRSTIYDLRFTIGFITKLNLQSKFVNRKLERIYSFFRLEVRIEATIMAVISSTSVLIFETLSAFTSPLSSSISSQ